MILISLNNGCKSKETCEQQFNKNYCNLPTTTVEQRANKAYCEIGSHFICLKAKGNYNEAIKLLNNPNILFQ